MTVNSTPAVGAIAQWNDGECTNCNVGHVAWVQSVNTNGTVNVEEYNVLNPYAYGTRPNVTAPRYIHVHDLSTPAFHCNYVNQWVDGVDMNEPSGTAGQTFTLRVDYKNTGTASWQNTGGTSNQNYVELRSVTTGGAVTDSWFDPVGWLSGRQRVVACSPSSVASTATASFSFQATIPVGKAVGNYPIYFGPFNDNSSSIMQDWGGMYWLVHVLAPTAPISLVVGPSGCSTTNSFTFNWGTADNPSGIGGYEWQIDGTGAPASAGGTSITTAAPATGTHTFYVRAHNLAGNRGPFASIGFCYVPDTGPCTGRQIPNTCVPSTQCYPAAAANMQTLPTMSADQWQAVGQPVRSMLVPGGTYSIGFEYRSTAATDIKLGLGTFNPASSNLGFAISQSALPTSTSEWKTYWSAPFTVTADQLSKFSSLRFVRPQTTADAVRILTLK